MNRFIIITINWLVFSSLMWAQDHADNSKCLKCHGQVFYEYYNEWTEQTERKPMNPFYHVDSIRMMGSVHKAFACTDCHSPEYETFPHAGELRLEQKYVCMDCHGGDETYAKYNFEGIEAAFMESVHYSNSNERFNCWMCHDPHGYELALREQSSVKDVVRLSNEMCMHCHTNQFEFGLLTDKAPSDLGAIHDWLPNQAHHFTKVRCVDCHTNVQDELLVSHKILPKDQAVKNCVQCHTSNSLLMESLYAHRIKESREESGFINATILNEGYIIGANRNRTLNIVSVVIFGLTVIGLSIHFILRLILIKKK